jgi:hypothetical protein
MPPARRPGPREGMTAASGTAVKGNQSSTWGSQNSIATYPAPASAFPGQADCRLPAARVKNALRAPAMPARPTAWSLTQPPAHTNQQPSGKAQPARQLPHARKARPASETPGHSNLTPARFFRDDLSQHRTTQSRPSPSRSSMSRHPCRAAALLCGMTPVSGHGERAAVYLLERVNASSLTWPGSTGGQRGRTHHRRSAQPLLGTDRAA